MRHVRNMKFKRQEEGAKQMRRHACYPHGLNGSCSHLTSNESRTGDNCHEQFDDVCSSMDSQLGDHDFGYP
ncbi:hypothetical protein TNCV_2870261 [Trichonephila clavipes]|nr:hypothetical protein TNCV_2870261 [Trichonephila clavipes]